MTNDFLTFFLNPPLPGKTPLAIPGAFVRLSNIWMRAQVLFSTPTLLKKKPSQLLET